MGAVAAGTRSAPPTSSGALAAKSSPSSLPGTDTEGALKVAENMREAVHGLTVTGIERDITASFGVAVLPTDAPRRRELLRVADRALYQAKANGRNCVETAAV